MKLSSHWYFSVCFMYFLSIFKLLIVTLQHFLWYSTNYFSFHRIDKLMIVVYSDTVVVLCDHFAKVKDIKIFLLIFSTFYSCLCLGIENGICWHPILWGIMLLTTGDILFFWFQFGNIWWSSPGIILSIYSSYLWN